MQTASETPFRLFYFYETGRQPVSIFTDPLTKDNFQVNRLASALERVCDNSLGQ
jgi:hypothetical protein